MNREIQEMVETLRQILNENILSKSLNNKIENTLKKINEIYNDKEIKIAVLGEFSSGKSTFINAFLNEEILDYGDEPTTAVNTYLKYGEVIRAKAILDDGKEKSISINKVSNYIKEDSKKKSCNKIVITHTNEMLKNGLVVIDTPGANIDINLHNIQRRKAIEESAVGVFLISIQSLTSKSFIKFLNDNKDLLSKVIFVITKCDLLEEESILIDMDKKSPKNKLRSAYDFIYDTIEKYSGLRNPNIYTISAKAKINNSKLKVINVKESFKDIEKCIQNISTKDKEKIILNEVVDSLNSILGEINLLLLDKSKTCESEIAKVNGELESFENFLTKTRVVWEKKLKDSIPIIRNKVNEKVTSEKYDYIRRISSTVNGFNSMSEFNKKASQYVNDEMYKFANRITEINKCVIDGFGEKEFQEVENSFINYFSNIKRTYEHLGILRRAKIKKYIIKLTIVILTFILSYYLVPLFVDDVIKSIETIALLTFMSILISVLYGNKNIKFYLSCDEYYSGVNIRNVSVGNYNSGSIDNDHVTGGGLIIGALVGGPIGAIVGAGLGALLGSFMFKEKLQREKERLLNLVENKLEEISERYIKSVNSYISSKEYYLKKGYDKYVSDNKVLYKNLLDGIDEYNKNIFLKLDFTNKTYKKYIKNIEKYLKYIDKQLSNKSNYVV